MLSFLFEIIGNNFREADVSVPSISASSSRAEFISPFLLAVSVFVGGIGTVMLFITLFSYFLGAGDEDRMIQAHNSLFLSFGMILLSIFLFFVAKLFI